MALWNVVILGRSSLALASFIAIFSTCSLKQQRSPSKLQASGLEQQRSPLKQGRPNLGQGKSVAEGE